MKLKHRVLLRSFETGAFFKTATVWTKDQAEAVDFEASAVAGAVARELGLKNVEVVVVTADGKVILDTRIGIEP